MPLDLPTFANKLLRIRDMFAQSIQQLADSTGIDVERLEQLEAAAREPTGDEVLILADHYHIDFRFFISNESSLPVDRAEKLFRAYSQELSSEDRLSIQEFIYLCENESFLRNELMRPPPLAFQYRKRGSYFKGHGIEAARALRTALAYEPREVPDVFRALRRLGYHVFRRRLTNDAISGLYLNHDSAGPCILVNYSEDVYRQRFTAAHESAHAIFDAGDEYVVSFDKWDHKDLREVRANVFASAFLVPTELVSTLPRVEWTDDRIRNFAEQLKVNAAVLAIALEREGRIDQRQAKAFMKLRMPRTMKTDPELPESLSAKSYARKRTLLERGISSDYAEMCFEAFQRHIITRARLAEMLLAEVGELDELMLMFLGRTVS